jgi:hypothetical protein
LHSIDARMTYADMICSIPDIALATRLNRMSVMVRIEEKIMQTIVARLVSFVVCAACALPVIAQAQTATQPMGASPHVEQAMQRLQTRFASANTTHDGKLTRDQAASGMPMLARHFDEIDTQKNGYVTLPQIEAYLREHAAQR